MERGAGGLTVRLCSSTLQCKVTFLIAHADAPAKSLGALATTHQTDVIILGRRKLGRLQKVVGAGSVGNWLLNNGFNVLVVQE